MTNEEAKSELFNLIISGEATKSNIALKMAIQAIDQQSNTENALQSVGNAFEQPIETREQQIMEGFTQLMRGLWNNPNLQNPMHTGNEFFNFDTPMVANISFDKDELQEIADELADEMRVKLDKCGDAVSRQEVKEKMQYYGFRAPDMTISEFIEDLPPVTPAKIHGKWIHWTDDICDYVRCSKCDYGDEGEVKLGEETNFCPACGSDNREVSE